LIEASFLPSPKGAFTMDQQPLDILLVEDNPYDLELTLRAFRQNKLANRVDVVRDGQEALDYLFRTGMYVDRPDEHPKVVLLDLKLPKVTGIEVLRKLRADPVMNLLPVVVLTTSQENSDVTECYRLGVNSFIVKPVEFSKFTEVVRELGMYWLVLNQPPAI
jgi:two-component system, response regulator